MISPSSSSINPARGEVWRVDLEPVQGSETGKIRPVVVISRETLGRLPVRLVVPITGWRPAFGAYPWMTRLTPTAANGLAKESAGDALQMRVASLGRFQERVGVLPAADADAIAASIGLCVGPLTGNG